MSKEESMKGVQQAKVEKGQLEPKNLKERNEIGPVLYRYKRGVDIDSSRIEGDPSPDDDRRGGWCFPDCLYQTYRAKKPSQAKPVLGNNVRDRESPPAYLLTARFVFLSISFTAIISAAGNTHTQHKFI